MCIQRQSYINWCYIVLRKKLRRDKERLPTCALYVVDMTKHIQPLWPKLYLILCVLFVLDNIHLLDMIYDAESKMSVYMYMCVKGGRLSFTAVRCKYGCVCGACAYAPNVCSLSMYS